ncbi:MAG: MBL fold metallo-hydrolase [Oscillospiraceae bacterium]|nr:MBL fold metallo-hydrolase [Oscillospiraceae bacterium]
MRDPAIIKISKEQSAKKRQERRKRRLEWFRSALPLMILGAAVVFAVLYLSRPRNIKLDDSVLTVIMLDVGQGDSILIHTSTNNVLVDCGDVDQGVSVAKRLEALGITRLDCLINSHPHADHLGGAADILRMMPVGTLYFPDIPENLLPTTGSYLRTLDLAEEKGVDVRIPKCGDVLSLGIADIRFLTVDNTQFENLNDCSLGIALTHGKNSILLTGDLETAGEKAWLEAGLLSPVTVLKCAHHGSNASTGTSFLETVQPAAAVISVGALNDYGHPSQKMLARLRAYTETIFRTDLDGNIRMVSDGEQVQITPRVTIKG